MVSWLCYALHVLLNKRYVNIKYLSRHILTLTILGLTIPKTVNIRWSPWSRIITRENHHLNGFNYGCQLTIRKLAKTKKKIQSIITKKFNLMFLGKSHHVLVWWSQWEPSRHQGLSGWYLWDSIKTHQGEVQKITVKYQLFKTSTAVN